jgi:putative oxidoreductase
VFASCCECCNFLVEAVLQRLFSNFASGWPGLGLLIQRIVTGSVLLYQGTVLLKETHVVAQVAAQIIGAVLGIFILAGLWTPVVGVLVAAVEVWITLAGVGDPWVSIILSALGGTLAMIGPGAWSVDARLFGRKHFAS